jgi:hypothetical protein
VRVAPERVDSGDAVSVVTRHPDRQPGGPIFERPCAFWLFDARCMGRTIAMCRWSERVIAARACTMNIARSRRRNLAPANLFASST